MTITFVIVYHLKYGNAPIYRESYQKFSHVIDRLLANEMNAANQSHFLLYIK